MKEYTGPAVPSVRSILRPSGRLVKRYIASRGRLQIGHGWADVRLVPVLRARPLQVTFDNKNKPTPLAGLVLAATVDYDWLH